MLGSILVATYQRLVPTAGLAPDAAEAVRASVFGGLAVAQGAGSQALADGVRSAFESGMTDTLRFAAVVALVGIVPAVAFLPRRFHDRSMEGAQSEHAPTVVAG